MSVYDLLGQRIETVQTGVLKAGANEVRFDAAGHSAGLYLYRVQAGGEVGNGKLLLAR
ncbi:MAG: T9SS type A sorting domain-containing protein [Ignavibacteria bacterium]|nr:T9SS type A sorting domain-containing protein [Ignavibacteria bacterium]